MIINPYRFASAPSADYATTCLAMSPQAYWRFNEASGLVAADSSGNGNHATFSGVATAPTWGQTVIVAGSGDTSVKCNSTTLGATLVDPNVFSMATATSGFTAVAWVQQANSGNQGRIFSGRDAGNSILNFGYGNNGAATGRVTGLVLGDNGAGLTSVIGAGPDMSLNTICMHVLRVKPDKTMQIFENNSVIGTATHAMTTGISPDATNTRLFQDPRNAIIGTFTQKISNLAVWHRALSDAEIADLWAAGT